MAFIVYNCRSIITHNGLSVPYSMRIRFGHKSKAIDANVGTPKEKACHVTQGILSRYTTNIDHVLSSPMEHYVIYYRTAAKSFKTSHTRRNAKCCSEVPQCLRGVEKN